MHYIIQENTFRERNYDRLIDTIRRFGFDYTIVKIFPYVDKIASISDIPDYKYNIDDIPEFSPSTKNVFLFGAIKLSRIAREKGWNPGSMLNDNHDYNVYKSYYGSNLLNYDSKILKIGQDIKWLKNEVKFIRPTKDTKVFNGGLYNKADWDKLVDYNLKNNSSMFNNTTEIQISSPKNIQKEIRFWVVDGKVVTGSQYRLGNSVVYSSLYDDDAKEFAQKMVNKYQLADAFVMDVCLHNDEWKIVECGCINSAGFYDCDIQKLLLAIDDKFNL